ncbi:hypothetical protein V6N13_048405 [Hibiscus sabdariffa]
MEQARLDCYSFRINCQCFIFFYASALINCLSRMTKGMSQQRQRVLPRQVSRLVPRLRQSVLLFYWLIPKSCNCFSCLYTISLGGKAATSLLPLSQEYFPHKANCCCIFLAAETLLLPIPRWS